MNGFFVTIKKQSKWSREWKAQLHEQLYGWSETKGATLKEVIDLQRQQYHAKKGVNGRLPVLTSSKDWPMASGRITRFVAVD